MRISSIIPTYNRAALLPETLDAVLAQSHPPHQTIVVDDGSTDHTQALLAEHYPSIRSIRIDNSGDLAARNVGLQAATGDLVAFCDSDDLWRPDHLARIARLWSSGPRPNCAFANFRHVIDGQWQAADKFAAAPPGFWDGLRDAGDAAWVFDAPIPERLLRFQPFFPSALVADRTFFASIGGWDEAVSRIVGGDFATALRLAEHAPLGVIRRVTVGIRKHAGNFSADVQAMNFGDTVVLEHVLATRPSLAPHAEAIRASIIARRLAAFEAAFARGDVVGARRIAALLPTGAAPGGRFAVKRAVARLPAPLAGWAAGLLARAGSLAAGVPHA